MNNNTYNNSNNKTIILIAGLPASGKDTVANIFEKQNYFLMIYSKHILKPIIENTKIKTNEFITKTIGKLPTEELEKITQKIERLKQTQTGRELYISVAQFLNRICSILTNKQHNHFTLFATTYYENQNKIAVSGFRQKPELDILKKIYPNATIKTIFVNSTDELRHERLKQRDNITEQTIIENEKYEIETTHTKMMNEIQFDYIITNNTTLKDLENQTLKIIDELK